MDIASNIKAVRKAKSITPTMMAKELGIEATNYPRLENRGNQLTYNNLEKIATALGITVIELLTWHEKQESAPNQKGNVRHLQARIEELEKQVAEKSTIENYLTRYIARVESWFCIYFRYEVWKVAVRLGMIEGDFDYLRVYDYYTQWGQEGVNRIVNEGLIHNPFIYQMMYKDIYIDHELFIKPTTFSPAPKDIKAFQVLEDSSFDEKNATNGE